MGSSKVMKSGSRSATTIAGSIALPFVISTGAQRSGEICGSAVLSWKCFSQRRDLRFFWPAHRQPVSSKKCRVT